MASVPNPLPVVTEAPPALAFSGSDTLTEAPALDIVAMKLDAASWGRNYRVAPRIVFAGCNMDCRFADGSTCNTAWSAVSRTVRVDDALAWVRMASGGDRFKPGSPLVITGGEPTLAPAFDSLVARAVREGFFVVVETNGTYWRDGLRTANWVTVSPKNGVAQGPRCYHTGRTQDAVRDFIPHEYRYVITPDSPDPPYHPAQWHRLIPARMTGPGARDRQGYVVGALARCREIMATNPRWRLGIPE